MVWDFLTGGPLRKTESNPAWIRFISVRSLFLARLQNITMNEPDVQRLDQGAVMAVATARDLARLFQLLLDGTILGPATLKQLLTATAEVTTRRETAGILCRAPTS